MSGYIPAGGADGATDPAGTGVVGAVVEFAPGGVVVGAAGPNVPALAAVVTVAPGTVAFIGGVVGVVPGAGVDPAGAGVALVPPVAVVGPMGTELRTSAFLVST